MTSRIARLGILGAGLVAVVAIVVISLDPNSYFFYRHQDRTQWQHPTTAVALFTIAAALETAVAYGVLAVRRPGRVWMRAFVGLAVLVPWGLWVGEFVVHRPGYWMMHLAWVWLVITALSFAVVVSGVVHVYSFLRTRPPTTR